MRKTLVAIAAVGLLALGVQANADEIATYNFTAGSLADSSGNGNDAFVSEGAFSGSGATFTNGAVVDGVRGDVFDLTGGGVGGNGSDGGLNLTLDVGGNNTGSWTMAMWMLNPNGTQGYLFDNRNTAVGTTAGTDRLIFSLGQSANAMSVFNGSAWQDPGSSAVDDGLWHHLAWTYDGSTLTSYVDGVAGTTPVTVAINRDLLLNDIELGNEGTGGGGGGQTGRLIDEVRIFNNALTASEVNALISAVPEPNSLLVLFSVAGMGLCVRRRESR